MATLTIGEAAFNALLGYVVVFIGLVLLMLVVMLVGKVMSSSTKKAAPAPAPAPAPVPVVAKVVDLPKAPGTAGDVKLYGTSDRDAAIIMAIVANKMGRPLNELRFISIKEVK